MTSAPTEQKQGAIERHVQLDSHRCNMLSGLARTERYSPEQSAGGSSDLAEIRLQEAWKAGFPWGRGHGGSDLANILTESLSQHPETVSLHGHKAEPIIKNPPASTIPMVVRNLQKTPEIMP